MTKLSGKKNTALLYMVIFTGFLVFGLSENIKGPSFPKIQSDYGIGEFELGLLIALNSTGYLVACSFTGAIIRRFGLKFTNLLAFVSMAVSGFFILISMSYPQFTVTYFLMYLGNGILEIALGILAARIFTENTGKMMNLAHFFYGLSSIAAPVIASSLMGNSFAGVNLGWRGMYCVILALSAIPLIPALLSSFPENTEDMEKKLSFRQYVKDRAAMLAVMVLTLGVVSELSIGSWLVNFLEKVYNWTPEASSGLLSTFFLVFTLGRLILGALTDKLGFVMSLVIFSAFSGLATVAGVLAGEKGTFLFVLSGFGISPVYPTVMAFLAKRYQKNSDTVISFTVILLGIGCVIGNFMVGAVIDFFKTIFTEASNSLVIGYQAGYAFIGICALICSAVAIILYMFLKKKNEVI